MAAEVSTPRERYRQRNRQEIKEVALDQLAQGGVEAIALTRIARQMGLSGPALYRYFASRDDLLAELVSDSYDDAAAALARVGPHAEPRATLHSLANAYRAWAMAQPHRYLLIQGTPVPGFAAPPDTVLRARAVLGPVLPVFADGEPVVALSPLVDELRTWLRADPTVAEWVHERTGLAARQPAAAVALAGTVMAWSQLHGSIGLEVSGQFSGMGHRGTTALHAQVELLADAFGLA